jgi:DNA-binding transcriptional LysR family regulator
LSPLIPGSIRFTGLVENRASSSPHASRPDTWDYHNWNNIRKTCIILTRKFYWLEMSTEPGTPTLDQLHVFLTVIEEGSFAGAARQLNRATSVISYTIGNLEHQLGLKLFDREATRRPQLTEAGRMVSLEARVVSSGIASLRARAKGMLHGLESELHLVLDTLVPEHRIVDGLTAFRSAFPTVTLHLGVETLGAVTKQVLDGIAGVGISGPLNGVEGVERISVGCVRLIPVAAPSHELASTKWLNPGAGRDHIQLVLTDRSELTKGRDFGVLGNRTWRLADLGSKYMLLKAGIGWGNMPEPMVREDIAAGRLVPLDLPDETGGEYRLEAIYRIDTPPGPAGAWFINHFRNQPN